MLFNDFDLAGAMFASCLEKKTSVNWIRIASECSFVCTAQQKRAMEQHTQKLLGTVKMLRCKTSNRKVSIALSTLHIVGY